MKKLLLLVGILVLTLGCLVETSEEPDIQVTIAEVIEKQLKEREKEMPTPTNTPVPTPTNTPVPTPTNTPVPTPTNTPVLTPPLSIASVVELTKPAVVHIQSGDAIGSGFILSKLGWIVTNAHVVDGERTVWVTLPNGQIRHGIVYGSFADEDIAVIKIEGFQMPILTMGNSDVTVVGQDVLALGYALDLAGEPTLTRGVISAFRENMFGDLSAIQTDTAMNPGNSGGPLLDMLGNVIGINTASYYSSQNVNLAIKINDAQEIISSVRGGIVHPIGQYTSAQYPYSIPVPNNWNVHELGSGNVHLLDEYSTGRLGIYITYVESGITTDQFAEEKIIAGADQDLEYYTKVSTEKIVLQGSIPAWAVTEEWKRPENDFFHKGKEIFFVVNGLGYMIYGDSERMEWETIGSILDEIIDKLKIELVAE